MNNQPIETNPPSFDGCAVLFCFLIGFWLFVCFVGSLVLNVIKGIIK
jgi:hypothetical protein